MNPKQASAILIPYQWLPVLREIQFRLFRSAFRSLSLSLWSLATWWAALRGGPYGRKPRPPAPATQRSMGAGSPVQSSLQVTEAPADILSAVSWETPEPEAPSQAIPGFLTLRNCEKHVCCFQPLSFGVICWGRIRRRTVLFGQHMENGRGGWDWFPPFGRRGLQRAAGLGLMLTLLPMHWVALKVSNLLFGPQFPHL